MILNRALTALTSRIPLRAATGTPKDLSEITRYAHRGLALNHTENTLDAFRTAIDAGAQWVETDVNTTRDGVVLIMHDATLNRVANHSGAIAQMTYTQVQEIPLNGGESVPTLEEALAAFPELNFNIDLKDAGSAEHIGEVLRRSGAWERVRLASFSENRLLAARDSLTRAGLEETDVRWSGAERSMIIFYLTAHIAPGLWPRVQKLAGGLLSDFDSLQIPLSYTVAGRRVPVLTRKLLATARRYGYRIDIWTIDDATTMKELAELGVDGIVTNRVDILSELAAD